MRQHIVPILIITAAALGTAACSEDQDRPPTGPDLHTVVGTSSSCDFGHLRQLANTFFAASVTAKQAAKDSLDDMETDFTADDYSVPVKQHGFNILALVDAAVNATPTPLAGDATVGSDFINHLILCMYDPTTEAASYPSTFPESFAIAVTPTARGAFAVPAASSSDPVKSRPTSAPYSAIGLTGTSWGATLSGNSPARVLFYGRPGPTTSTFDWKTLPRNAGFSPDIVVAVCLDATTNNTAVLSDEHVGILPFVDAAFLNPATCSPTSSMLLRDPVLFAKRLLDRGAEFFSPEPLMAAAFSPGGVGGRTSGIGTVFGPDDVTGVELTMGAQPINGKVNQVICGNQGSGTCPPVTVIATASIEGGGTDGMPNTSVRVIAVNNNGSTVVLTGTNPQVTDNNGVAKFDNLKLNKSGSYRLVFAGSVIDREEGIDVKGVTSNKFLEAPAK